MNCPRCGTPLTAHMRASIEVDVCGNCRGIWLDGGELAKIVDAEQARRDAEMRANWRLYDRGRDSFDPTETPGAEKSALESLLQGD